MSYRPARRLADIEPFHVVELLTRARQLEAEGRDIIHMEVGEPDFPTPEPDRQCCGRRDKKRQNLYTQALGLPELRRQFPPSIAAAMASPCRPAASPSPTALPAPSIWPSPAWLTRGANGCWPTPATPCNRHILRVYEGGRSQHPGRAGEQLPADAGHPAHSTGTPRTAGLLVASPANPTGTLLTLSEIKALADDLSRARRPFSGRRDLPRPDLRGSPVGGRRRPTACAAGDDIWVINSFSKYFQMTGWRLGWMVIPEAYVRDVEKLAQNLVLCPSTPAQYGRWRPFEPETIAILEARRAEFRRRRDFLAPALESARLPITARPEGAFYLYCDCSALATTASRWPATCWKRPALPRHPGLDFGSNAPEKHIRFAYTTGVDRLAEAVERLAATSAGKASPA
jgi:aspartate/methionine/tyrosine aminotransferase